MFWGKMMIVSNGLSYMDYKIHLEINKVMDGAVTERYIIFLIF